MKNANDSTVVASPEYRRFVEDLKARVISARTSAARAVNRDLTLLYWDIGRGIVEKQQLLGWGESVVEMVSAELRRAFPQMTGFSPRNVWYMRRLFEVYGASDFLQQVAAELKKMPANPAIWPETVAKLGGSGASSEFLQQLVAEIPWGHHLLILDKLSAPAARLYYLRATARFGWTRNVLLNQIEHQRCSDLGVGLRSRSGGRNSFRVQDFLFTVSQGSRCAPTLGSGTESCWDSQIA